VREIVSSLRSQLFAWSKLQGVSFQYATMLYMQEGVLSRIADSSFADTFILKGGFLLFSIFRHTGRTTRDLDLLGKNISNNPKILEASFQSILDKKQDDGLFFDTKSIQINPIVEGAEYQGLRLHVVCFFGTVRNRLQIDIGFGDALSQGPVRIPFKRILGRGEFEVLSYPLSAVVAEKFETLIALDAVNSRMKDLFDIALILNRFTISDQELKKAFAATFKQRGTNLPDNPAIFSEFYDRSPTLQEFWKGFLRRSQLGDANLNSIIDIIQRRLKPIYESLKNEI